jgi:transposase
MKLSPEDEAKVRRLYFAEHWPVGTIVTQLRSSDEAVRRVLCLLNARPKPPPKPRLIEPYQDFIVETLTTYPTLRSTRIFDMIRARGFTGSPHTVRREVGRLRPARPSEAFLRVEVLIGEQAQVDWAQVGTLSVPGGERPVWVFVMILSHSRALWAELVFEQTVPSLCRSLIRASSYFGGCPRQWLFDSPRTIVVERFGATVRFQPPLLDLASRFCVQPRVCAVRRPQQKGRVERAVRYLRDRFFAGRALVSIEQGNAELLRFLEEIALPRPHPTLIGRSVADVLAEERPKLLSLPNPLPSTELTLSVTPDKTAFVRFDRNDYSVPWTLAGQPLTLYADDRVVRVVKGIDDEVARHERCWGKRQRVLRREHHQGLLDLRPAAQPSKGLERLQRELPQVDHLCRRWVELDFNIGTQVARTLHLLDLYGRDLLAAAVLEAVKRNLGDVGALSQLCEQARRAQKAPVPIDVPLGDHVPDRDVIPHPLSRYDHD